MRAVVVASVVEDLELVVIGDRLLQNLLTRWEKT